MLSLIVFFTYEDGKLKFSAVTETAFRSFAFPKLRETVRERVREAMKEQYDEDGLGIANGQYWAALRFIEDELEVYDLKQRDRLEDDFTWTKE